MISWGVELNSSTAVRLVLKWAVGGRAGRKGPPHPGSCRVPLHLGGKPREEGIPAGLEPKGQWRRQTSLGHDRKTGPRQRCLEKADWEWRVLRRHRWRAVQRPRPKRRWGLDLERRVPEEA